MDMFSRLRKLDSSLQRGIDNGFARVFGGAVVPAELEEALKGEAEGGLVYGPQASIYAPDHYSVFLSGKDEAKLKEQSPDLAFDMADRLSRYIRNSNWNVYQRVVVKIVVDEGLHSGQLKIRSAVSQPETIQQPAALQHNERAWSEIPGQGYSAPHSASDYAEFAEVPEPEDSDPHQATAQTQAVSVVPTVILLLQDGSSRSYTVHEGSNIIGRGNQVDFRLPDTGVSRRHAEIIWDGAEAVLVDLHSTNGTTVNDTPIDNWLLADGDVICMGHSYIEVRIHNPAF